MHRGGHRNVLKYTKREKEEVKKKIETGKSLQCSWLAAPAAAAAAPHLHTRAAP